MGIGKQAYVTLRNGIPRSLRAPVAAGIESLGTITHALRGLPTFLIVGAQRSGTNSLYEYLIDHPAIGRALPGQEVHFFDLRFDRGLDWYRGHFPTRLWSRSKQMRLGSPVLAGESSPYYMFHPLAPERILATLPTVKLIVLLRNPVDRAYSHYHHERAHGREPLSFEEATEREPQRIDGEAERIREDPTYHSFSHQHFSYLARGQYADQLETLGTLFPQDQILILISEHLFAEPDAVHSETLRFLGLESTGGHRYRRYNAGRYDGMGSSIRRHLSEHFKASNDRLVRLLGTDVPWD